MSLRARLLLGMAVVGVVLVAASVSILRATEHNLVRQVDQQLARSTPEARVGDRRPGIDDDGVGYGPPVAGQRLPPSSLYVARVDRSSGELTILYLPTTADGEPSAPGLTTEQVEAHLGEGPFTVDAADGDLRYRTIVRTQGRADQVIVLALPLSDVDETIDRLLTILAISAAVILGVLALVTFWVLRLGVRPVQRMTATAKAIGQGDLSQRIPDSAPGTEAGELGLALNQMLGRIEGAFDERSRSEARLRQFVADASHELRTPVTTIRGYAELYRIGGLTGPAELDEAMRRTEQEAARMGQLVADMLDLARLDQGRPLQVAPVDLTQLITDGAADLRAVEPERPVTTEAAGPVIAVADEPLLRQIIANLTTNARVHTPAGTPIVLRARVDGTNAVLEVADEGPGMAPEVAERAFERFYRADPARARQTGGSGLGLAIVAGTVAAHGGQIAVHTAPGQGTCVRIGALHLPGNVVGGSQPVHRWVWFHHLINPTAPHQRGPTMKRKKTFAAVAMTAAVAGGSLVGATLGNPLASGAQDETTTTVPSETTPSETPAPDAGRPGGRGGFDGEAAAEALGITTDELQTQIEAGKTLAQIAEAQGVDKQALIDALVAAGNARLDEAKANLPDRVAELVDSTLPARGEGGPGDHGGRGGPGGHGAGLDAAATALGITADELRTQVQDGKTIAEIAEAQGVDKQAVIDAMVAEVKTHLDEEVANGDHTQEEADAKLAEATERITTMVDEGRPAGGPGQAPPGN